MKQPKDFPECEGCCNCCLYAFYTVATEDVEEEEFEYHKARSVSMKLINGQYIFKLYQPCSKIDEETGLCTIYKKRPKHCKLWPKIYVPTWAHYCKLMRETLKPRDHFSRLRIFKLK